MSFFEKHTNRILAYANTPYIAPFFALISLASATFIPLPADPIFILIGLQEKRKIPALVLAGTIGITLGGLVMYGIGYALFNSLGGWIITTYHWEKEFVILQDQLATWGGWLLVIKAFTPIPYKLLSLICGFGKMNVVVFLVASATGRFLRFAVEGIFVRLFGETILFHLQRRWRLALLLFVTLTVFGFFVLKFIK
jgi:membrane protein YqaA with SNARE-associated domain